MQAPETPSAERHLTQADVWAMAFGCMVGWGVFAMPGNTFLPVAGPAGTFIALAVGMAIMLVVARNFSFLMGRSAMAGGVYAYTKEAFGRDHAFLSSWFLCLSYLTIVFLNGTALFYVARIMLGDASGGIHYTIAGNDIYLYEIALSTAVLAVAGALCVTTKPFLRRLFTVLSLVLFAGIAVVVAACLPRAMTAGTLFDFGANGGSPLHAVLSLIVLAPWAFVGFEITSFDTGSFAFPARRTWRILALSIVATAFAYTSMALISVSAVPEPFASWQDYVLGLDGLSGVASVPTFFAAQDALGTAGLCVMTVTAVAAILTGIIWGYRATTRVLSAMAEDHILSQRFTKPSYSVPFVMGASILLSLLGRNTLNWFVDLTSLGAIIGFGYTSAAAWKIAKMEGNRTTVATGAVGTVLSVLFVVVQLVPRLAVMEAMGSQAYLLLALWCLLGFVFYWRTIQHSNLAEYSGLSTSGVVLFSLIIYSSLMWLAKRLMAAQSMEQVQETLLGGALVVLPIIFVGLVIMLYVQNLVRSKHEESERQKIRAVESSLAKSQFLFNMSHDIRTPMNAIIGYTNLALQEPASPKVRDYLTKIDRSNQQLLSLINDILEMSRIESGKVELELAPTDMRQIFENMRLLFEEQMAGKGIDFRVHTAQLRDVYVWCDQKNLDRILLNVLNNAFKFTPEGGNVSLSVWEIGRGEGGRGSYEIRIQDNGIGMSKEFASRMFTAFERERTSTASGIEGTGLGMSITKNLVDLMGGTIEVLTSPGNGTEVIVRLGFALATAEDVARERERQEAPRAAARDFSHRRLLLVEDNAINSEIATTILEQAGFAVETAENGEVAVRKVREAEPGHYDAILMDIQMPVMDGYEATRAIRALGDPARANVPILAMTANAFKEDQQAAREAGMQAHIAKPIDVDVMLATIADVLDQA